MIIGNCPVCGADMRVGSDMTNADRVRAMTDEELAYELAVSGCPKIYFSKDKGRVDCRAESELTEGDCVKCWLDWLKQEVSE